MAWPGVPKLATEETETKVLKEILNVIQDNLIVK
jgi:hypothetical protein